MFPAPVSRALALLPLAALALAGCSSKSSTTAPVVNTRRQLGPAVHYTTNGVSAAKTTIGDVNADGRNDVVVTSGGSVLLVYLQSAAGTLDPPIPVTTDLILRGAAIGDLDHDGRSELAVSGISIPALSGWLGRLAVFEGDPTSGTPPHEYVVGSNNVGDVAIGDFDGDGLLDAAVTADVAGVSVFRQTGADTLGPEVMCSGAGASVTGDLAVGDVTGDGRADLVFKSGMLAIAVVARSADGSLSPTPSIHTVQTSYWPTFDALAVGDLDGDRLADVVVVAPGNNSYLNLFHQRGGTLADPVLIPEPYPPFGVEIADIDGDGLNDILGETVDPGTPARGSVRVYLQSVAHTFAGYTAYSFVTTSGGGSANTRALAVGDVTGDGYPDAVMTWQNEGLWVLPSVPAP